MGAGWSETQPKRDEPQAAAPQPKAAGCVDQHFLDQAAACGATVLRTACGVHVVFLPSDAAHTGASEVTTLVSTCRPAEALVWHANPGDLLFRGFEGSRLNSKQATQLFQDMQKRWLSTRALANIQRSGPPSRGEAWCGLTRPASAGVAVAQQRHLGAQVWAGIAGLPSPTQRVMSTVATAAARGVPVTVVEAAWAGRADATARLMPWLVPLPSADVPGTRQWLRWIALHVARVWSGVGEGEASELAAVGHGSIPGAAVAVSGMASLVRQGQRLVPALALPGDPAQGALTRAVADQLAPCVGLPPFTPLPSTCTWLQDLAPLGSLVARRVHGLASAHDSDSYVLVTLPAPLTSAVQGAWTGVVGGETHDSASWARANIARHAALWADVEEGGDGRGSCLGGLTPGHVSRIPAAGLAQGVVQGAVQGGATGPWPDARPATALLLDSAFTSGVDPTTLSAPLAALASQRRWEHVGVGVTVGVLGLAGMRQLGRVSWPAGAVAGAVVGTAVGSAVVGIMQAPMQS